MNETAASRNESGPACARRGRFHDSRYSLFVSVTAMKFHQSSSEPVLAGFEELDTSDLPRRVGVFGRSQQGQVARRSRSPPITLNPRLRGGDSVVGTLDGRGGRRADGLEDDAGLHHRIGRLGEAHHPVESSASASTCCYVARGVRLAVMSTAIVESPSTIASTCGVCGSLLRPHHRPPLHQPLQRQAARLASLDDGADDGRRQHRRAQDAADAGAIDPKCSCRLGDA